jgi:general secretion pathway protein F
MPLFNYSALDTKNSIKKGILDEPDKKAVARHLMNLGLRPLEITPHARKKESLSFSLFQTKKLNRADLDFFTKQIAMLLGTGLSLDASLRVIKQHRDKPAFKEFTGSLEQKLKEGKSFSEALAEYPMHFSSMYISMVKAGEEGSILPQMLKKLNEYQASFRELKQFVISASIYPAVLMCVGLLACLILVTTILPRFELLFEGMSNELPLHVSILMNSSKIISNNLLIFGLIIIAIPAGIVMHFRSKEGQIFYDRLALKTPLISNVVRNLETTRIFRTIEALVNNGVHFATALKISSGVASNQAFQQMLKRATETLKEGKQISKRLKEEGVFPEMATELLAIGEESGKVGEICSQVADHFEEELRLQIKRVIALIEPVFILLMAVGAGYVVISMLSVILSMNQIAG